MMTIVAEWGRYVDIQKDLQRRPVSLQMWSDTLLQWDDDIGISLFCGLAVAELHYMDRLGDRTIHISVMLTYVDPKVQLSLHWHT